MGFALNCKLSDGGNCIIWHFNRSYLEGEGNEASLQLYSEIIEECTCFYVDTC